MKPSNLNTVYEPREFFQVHMGHGHTRDMVKNHIKLTSPYHEQRTHMELDQNEEVHLKLHRALSVPCGRMNVM